MTSTLSGQGRMCNGIIRNLGVSLIAEKFGLNVTYQYADEMSKLGLHLFSGSNVYPTTLFLRDDNYTELFNGRALLSNLAMDPDHCYLQTPEVSTLAHSFLRRPEVMSSVIAANPYKDRYQSNNSTFVHVRLTDVKQWSSGSRYYLKAIAATQFDTLYIASDDLNDEIIKEITAVYPAAILFAATPIQTIQFGSTCRNVILSGGSFSGTIGLLSFFSSAYYSESSSTTVWWGDMFSGHGWTRVTC